MNKQERIDALEFTRHAVYDEKIGDDERIDRIVTYHNCIVRKYATREYFDEIKRNSDTALRQIKGHTEDTASWCCCPCKKALSLCKFVIGIMFFVVVFLAFMYIVHFFIRK